MFPENSVIKKTALNIVGEAVSHEHETRQALVRLHDAQLSSANAHLVALGIRSKHN